MKWTRERARTDEGDKGIAGRLEREAQVSGTDEAGGQRKHGQR
jgi:hypothetical protein